MNHRHTGGTTGRDSMSVYIRIVRARVCGNIRPYVVGVHAGTETRKCPSFSGGSPLFVMPRV